MGGARTRVLYVPSDRSACAWYRAVTPGKALADGGWSTIISDNLRRDLLETCDVLVAQRSTRPAILDAFAIARSLGKFIVFDIDDDLWAVPEGNPAQEYFSRPEVGWVLTEACRQADLVTTPSAILAKVLRARNRNVAVIPNLLPDEYWSETSDTLRGGSKVVIGWAGGPTHAEDISIVREPLLEVLERHPSTELHLAGGDPEWMPAHPRIRHLPWVDITDHPRTVMGFDIGIAPLKSNHFNACKSDLKVVEYWAAGLPVVASAHGPYETTVRHGENGMLAGKPKDWLRHLSALIEDGDLRSRMGEAARRAAAGRMISRGVDRYVKAYGLCR